MAPGLRRRSARLGFDEVDEGVGDRRPAPVAVGHQERLEAIEAPDGWLSEGHGLDLTMLATAADFETRTNGATHMGNDDAIVFDAITTPAGLVFYRIRAISVCGGVVGPA